MSLTCCSGRQVVDTRNIEFGASTAHGSWEEDNGHGPVPGNVNQDHAG